MKEKLSKILDEALAQIQAPDADIEQIKVKYLGKKGELTAVLRGMGALSAEERPVVGQMANDVRAKIEAAIAEKATALQAKALEEKLAELEHIAFCLGARSCSIEIIDDNREKNERKTKSKTSIDEAENATSVESMNTAKRNNRGKIETTFSQSSIPQLPRLKWFAHNDNMRNLIEMRLSENGSVRSKTLELSGNSSATMTQKTAIAIDHEIAKMGIKSNNNIERQAQIEKNSKLIFEVIFED